MARFGYSIRTLRQARRMSAAQLAAKAAISPTYLSLIEGEERIPPSETLARLAEALSVDIALLETLLPTSDERVRSARIRELGQSLRRLERAEQELRRKLG